MTKGKIAQNNEYATQERAKGREALHPDEFPFPSCAKRCDGIIGTHQGYLYFATYEGEANES